MGKEKTYAKQTHVPDKVYSFSLQIRHMLNELIKAQPNDIISLEALDDVAIQNNEKSELIQVKSLSLIIIRLLIELLTFGKLSIIGLYM